MFTKEWKAEYKGHQLVVANNWGLSAALKTESGGAKLYIDGKCVDKNNSTFVTSKVPIMRGNIKIEDNVHIVEVYMKSGVFKVTAKIVVDGEKLAGDLG